METSLKLSHVATQMHLESAEDTGVQQAVAPCGVTIPRSHQESRQVRLRKSLGIFNAALPGGKSIPLLKTLLTSACERNCYYCPFRAGRNYRRTTFKPPEMAQAFMDMVDAGLVKGIFLSSGVINGGVTTQDKLLDTVDILRRQHGFRGYVHLKIMPGAEKAQVERAMQLADRLSVNLEAPTSKHLANLAPSKQLVAELMRPLRWIQEIRSSRPAHLGWNHRWPTTVTQFVVGAVGDTDVELLHATDYLYRKLRLSRAYYSPFRPIEDTPLAHLPPTPEAREHRLYQASFLLRDYGFELESLPFDQSGNLPLHRDPKQAWAEVNLAHEPVELNRATRHELLRVPGIGPKGATSILRARRTGRLTDPSHLKAIGVRPEPLLPYILLNGQRPHQQLSLFQM